MITLIYLKVNDDPGRVPGIDLPFSASRFTPMKIRNKVRNKVIAVEGPIVLNGGIYLQLRAAVNKL